MKIYFLTVPQEQALKQALDAEGLYIEDEDGERSYYGNVPGRLYYDQESGSFLRAPGVTLDWIGEYKKLAGYDQEGEPKFTPVVGFHVNIYAPDEWELPPALTGYSKRPVTPHRLPAGYNYEG